MWHLALKMLLSGALGFGFNSWDIQFSRTSIKKWVIRPLCWRWDGVLLGILLGSSVKFAVPHYYIVCMLAFNWGWTVSLSLQNVRTCIVSSETHITCHTTWGDIVLLPLCIPRVHESCKNCSEKNIVNVAVFFGFFLRDWNNMLKNRCERTCFYLLCFLPTCANNIKRIKVKYFLWSWNEYSLLSTFWLDCTAT